MADVENEGVSQALTVVVKIQILSGKGEEFIKTFQEAFANAIKESGTRYYMLNVDIQNPDIFWIYEFYENQSAFEEHITADWFKKIEPKLKALVSGPVEINMLKPLGGKGF